MGFPLKDVRYSTRRAKDASPDEGGDATGGAVAETRTLYPRLLRDKGVLPKVSIAVEYFQSLVGRERREMDAEVLVQFFGDHKLARCVVASLATSYRYRSPEFREVCSRTALRKLERAAAAAPKGLRALLYARLNDERGAGEPGDGFMRRSEQGETYGALERRLSLRAGQLERLLYLDADEHALLTRTGPAPRPEDVVAQYNFGILETLLRHAETVRLTLTDGAGKAALAEAVADLPALGAEGDVGVVTRAAGRGAAELQLAGRADAMGGWARHGRRVARTIVRLLERSRRVVDEGSALVVLRDRRALLRLTPEVLDLLSLGTGAAPDAGWADLPGWEGEAVRAGIQRSAEGLRRRPRSGDAGASPAEGGGRWGLRRLPEAQAWASGVLIPDLRLVRGSAGPAVRLCTVRSLRHAERLAVVGRGASSGEPVVFLGPPEAVSPLLAAGLPTVVTPEWDVAPVINALEASAIPGVSPDQAAGAAGAEKPGRRNVA